MRSVMYLFTIVMLSIFTFSFADQEGKRIDDSESTRTKALISSLSKILLDPQNVTLPLCRLEKEAKDVGLQMSDLKIHGVAKGKFIDQQNISFNLSGSYDAIAKFFGRVGKVPILLNTVQLKLEKNQKSTSRSIYAKCVISAFIKKRESEDSAEENEWLERKADALIVLRSKRTLAVHMLDEIRRSLAKNVSLTTIDLKNEAVKITGTTTQEKEIPQFLKEIENSYFLSMPRLAMTRVLQPNKTEFQISIAMENLFVERKDGEPIPFPEFAPEKENAKNLNCDLTKIEKFVDQPEVYDLNYIYDDTLGLPDPFSSH